MESNTEGEKIIRVNIENQMKTAYIDYSMSVIVSRALPDIRDGLKPVHRRILYAMLDLGILSNRPYKKSARIVGEVLGKYHPHGDTSVYDAMVRMAQEWSLRYPLIDGQGNFGSMDDDSPAAMRYTEARLRKIAEELLEDIDKETVDFQLNFDDSLEEPTVLPAKIPNLLINGASGIAVGMATNMPPHNLSEVVDGVIAYIDHHDISTEELMKFIKAPDFPTGGTIYGYEGVREAYETGRGRIVLRGEATVENIDNREVIIVSSIPFMVNKAEMIKRTADLVNEKKIEGIHDLRDESDRSGLRIVYELKKDAVASVVLNKLYQLTALQSSFSVNNIALVHGRPMTLSLKNIIKYFVEHRHQIVVRRTEYDLREAQKRAHILEGLLIALDHLDAVIALIRASINAEEARNGLMSNFGLTEVQARAILDMRLQRLTGLEQEKIREEYAEILKLIDHLQHILSDESLRMDIIKNELREVKEKYGDARRSRIELSASDFRIEDTIADEDVVITISHLGYVKRTNLNEYRVQSRGGRGFKGSDIRSDDFVEHLFIASNHNYMLFFTEKGRCFWLRVFEIPEGSRTSKGRAIQNLISLEQDDKVKAYINVKNLKDDEYINSNFIILVTRQGTIKKTSLEAYSRPRQIGINAINIKEGDSLLEARLTNGTNEVIIALKSGKAIRFNEATVRPMGRTASGVRGITPASGSDEVIGMICLENEEYDILVASENGFGKRSSLNDYRVTNRGGKGVKTINITSKTGDLIAIKKVKDTDDLMIITKLGITIRLPIHQLRVMGRATQGVKLINLKNGDAIAAISEIADKESAEVPEAEIQDTEIQDIDIQDVDIQDADEIEDQEPETDNGTIVE